MITAVGAALPFTAQSCASFLAAGGKGYRHLSAAPAWLTPGVGAGALGPGCDTSVGAAGLPGGGCQRGCRAAAGLRARGVRKQRGAAPRGSGAGRYEGLGNGAAS